MGIETTRGTSIACASPTARWLDASTNNGERYEKLGRTVDRLQRILFYFGVGGVRKNHIMVPI